MQANQTPSAEFRTFSKAMDKILKADPLAEQKPMKVESPERAKEAAQPQKRDLVRRAKRRRALRSA
ncbi:MAG TPA: hypothetical protein VF126_00570 [Acidobacteriaceae bacterium]